MNTDKKLADALRAILAFEQRITACRIDGGSNCVQTAREALAEYDARLVKPPVTDAHTAEPWRASSRFVVARNYRVTECDGPGGIGKADAARIVACVNACAGIPTEALQGVRLSGPEHEAWCSTDSLGEYYGWEPLENLTGRELRALPEDKRRTVFVVTK